MNRLLIIAGAVIAAIAFASPASAKNAKHGYGMGQGNAYKAKPYKGYKAMPLRANKGGALRGQDRARYVRELNRTRSSRY